MLHPQREGPQDRTPALSEGPPDAEPGRKRPLLPCMSPGDPLAPQGSTAGKDELKGPPPMSTPHPVPGGGGRGPAGTLGSRACWGLHRRSGARRRPRSAARAGLSVHLSWYLTCTGARAPSGRTQCVSAAGISLYDLQEQIVTTWRLFRPADILSAAGNLPRGCVYTTVTGRSYSPGLPLSTLLFPLRLDGRGDSEKPLATSCPPSKPARLACPP